MTVRPTFDLARFGADVVAAVGNDHGSYRKASARLPGVHPGMLSKAVNGKRLAPETVLHLCASLGLNVWGYYGVEGDGFTAKSQSNQPVTACVARETSPQTDQKRDRASGLMAGSPPGAARAAGDERQNPC